MCGIRGALRGGREPDRRNSGRRGRTGFRRRNEGQTKGKGTFPTVTLTSKECVTAVLRQPVWCIFTQSQMCFCRSDPWPLLLTWQCADWHAKLAEDTLAGFTFSPLLSASLPMLSLCRGTACLTHLIRLGCSDQINRSRLSFLVRLGKLGKPHQESPSLYIALKSLSGCTCPGKLTEVENNSVSSGNKKDIIIKAQKASL